MALFAFWREDAVGGAAAPALHRRLAACAHVDPALTVAWAIETAGGRWHLAAFATRTRFYAPEAQVHLDPHGGACVIHGLIWRARDVRPRALDAAAVAALLREPGDELPGDVAGEYAVARLHLCGSLTAFGDPAGLHQIFYRPDRDGVVASRAGFAALLGGGIGGGDRAIDPHAGAWIATIGYRVGTATAYAGVRQLAAGTMLADGAIRPLGRGIAPPAAPRGFAHGGDALLERGIAEAQAAIRLAAGADGTIDLPVTGGKDSRAVLALALAAGMRDRLRPFTRGAPGHPDVVAGAALAAAAGLRHRREPPLGSDEAPDWPLDRFHAALARLAFQTDGNMGGWDMVTGRTAGAATLVTGHLGELLKAYAKRALPDALDPVAMVRLQAPFDPLALLRPDARARMVEELAAGMAADRRAGAGEDELPDLFYLRHRVPNWLGGIRGVKSFERQPVLPLGVPSFTALAFRMTAAERKAELAHYRIVERCAPALLPLPFAHQRWDAALPGAPDVAPVLAAAHQPLFGNWQYSLNTRPEIRAHLAHLFAATDLALWDAIDREAAIERLRHRRIDYFDGIALLGLAVSVYHGAGLLLTERLADPAAPALLPVAAPPPATQAPPPAAGYLDVVTGAARLAGTRLHLARAGEVAFGGWLCAPDWPAAQPRVTLWADGKAIATAPADRPRADLAEAGIGDGRHGFRLAVPAAALRDAAVLRLAGDDGVPLVGGRIAVAS